MLSPTKIHEAVAVLKTGGLVAFPTETVYGLGADASNPAAIEKIFHAKDRPRSHPLIVHIMNFNALEDWAMEISPYALPLAEAFWPGPLTLVFRKKPNINPIVSGGKDTIALRMPNHPVARSLLEAFGGGIAGPSANKFTRLSPTNAKAVAAELGEKVDLILDGGQCEVGLESTIIDLSQDKPALLRPGMISQQAIENVLQTSLTHTSTTRAPGQHHLHYSPRTRTKLVNKGEGSIPSSKIKIAYLGFSHQPSSQNVVIHAMPRDPHQYAYLLYDRLRTLDDGQYDEIQIEAVPDSAEWLAIRDRIKKACHQSGE